MCTDFCGTTCNIIESKLADRTLKMAPELNHLSEVTVLKFELCRGNLVGLEVEAADHVLTESTVNVLTSTMLHVIPSLSPLSLTVISLLSTIKIKAKSPQNQTKVVFITGTLDCIILSRVPDGNIMKGKYVSQR